MKFSYRQILASAGGAVLSAVIASIFGVKGTIVGVAIGSIAATMGTALVFQSIERTNKAVKQVVVRVPEHTKLLRRLGGTKAAGVTHSEPSSESALQEGTATSASKASATVEESGTTPTADEEPGDGQTPVSAPAPDRRNLRWPLIGGMVVAVFVVSLLLVTVVELIAGRPLADLFGHGGGGTTVEKIFESPPPTLPAPTTTTSTTTTSSSTTTTSSSTTTSVVGSTTSSTGGGSTTTSSSSVSGPATPTSTPGSSTSP